MNIYHDDGADALLDLRRARDELKASGAINHEPTRRAIVAEITAGALLDIAYSLRSVGAEAASALRYEAETRAELSDVDETMTDAERDFLIEGDLVHLADDDEPGEVLKLGWDQGALFAVVKFAESGSELKVWTKNLVRLIGDEPPADLVNDVLEKIADEDELDDDFAAPEPSALDRLAEKAEKKGKKK